MSAILTICDAVSILRVGYMQRSDPKHSGGLDPSKYKKTHPSVFKIQTQSLTV